MWYTSSFPANMTISGRYRHIIFILTCFCYSRRPICLLYCYFNWHLSKQKLHHYMYICSILAGYRLDSFVCQQNQLLILCWTHREKYFVKTKIFLKFKVEQSCLLSILWENAQKISWNQSAWWFSKQICSEDCICSDVSMYIVYLFLIIIL